MYFIFCDVIDAAYLFLIADDRVLILEFSHDKAQVRLVVRNGPIEEAIVSLLVAQGEGIWEIIQLCGDVRPDGVYVTSSPEKCSLTGLQKLKRGSDRSVVYETCGLIIMIYSTKEMNHEICTSFKLLSL